MKIPGKNFQISLLGNRRSVRDKPFISKPASIEGQITNVEPTELGRRYIKNFPIPESNHPERK